MASLERVIDQLKVNNNDNVARTELVANSVTVLTGRIDSLLAIMKQSQLDMLEALREKGAPEKEDKPSADPIKKETSKLPMILAGIAAVAAGILAGLLDSVKKLAQIFRVDRLLKGLNTRFVKFIDNAIQFADDLFKPLRLFFSAEGGFGRSLTGLRGTFRQTFTGILNILDDLIQPFKTLMSGDGVVGQRLTKFFNGIIDIFKFPFEPIIDDFGKGIKSVFGAGEDGVGFFKRILNSVKAVFTPITGAVNKTLDLIKGAFSIFDEGSKLMGILGSIGRVIGRLFLPFTLVMTAFDTVKGAIAGFEEEGFLGGLAGAVEGFLNSIVGAPLDLLKSGASFLLKKLGFDDAAKVLEGFNFSDIITDIIFSPIEMLKRAFNGLIELIADAVEAFDIPFVDEKAAADSLREFKFEEGRTKSEKRAEEKAKGTDEGDALSGIIAQNQADMEKRVADIEEKETIAELEKPKRGGRRRSRGRGAIGPAEQQAEDLVPSKSEPIVTTINNISQDNSQNGSSSQAMVMPHVAAQDMTDPYELAFAP